MRDQLNKGELLSTPLKTKKNSFFQGGETKRMKTRKLLASFLAFAMLLSIVAVPVGSADAATTYSATSVPSFADGTGGNQKLGSIKITIDPLTTTSSAIFKLPYGAKLAYGSTATKVINVGSTGTPASVTPFAGSDNEFKLTIENPGTTIEESTYIVDIVADIKALSTGDIPVTITNIEGQLPSGNVVVGTIGRGSVGVTAETPDYIAGTGSLSIPANKVVVTFTEKQAGALKGATTLVLPAGYTWVEGTVSRLVSAPNAAAVAASISTNGKELTIPASSFTGKDVVRVEAAITVNDLTARQGDVAVTLRGQSSFDTNRLVVAKFGDFGVKVSAKDETTFVAGRGADGRTAETGEIGTITIEETAPGSLTLGRTIYLKLPAGAKWNLDNVENHLIPKTGIIGAKGLELVAGKRTGTVTSIDVLVDHDASSSNNQNRTLRLVVDGQSSSGAGKVELKGLRVDTGIGFSGDLEVEVSGNAGLSGTVKVAEVTPAVKVTIDKVDVQIGTRAQKIGKITIEEQFAGALMKATNGSGEFKFTFDNVMAGLYTKSGSATVTGDDELEVGMATQNDKKDLVLEIDRESSKPAKIEITGVEITLDRTVPEGDFLVNVGGGSALKDTKHSFTGAMARVAQLPIATVVTPAPGAEPGAAKVVFTQDSKEYSVNGEKFLAEDAAPFNKDGRVFVPMRLLATALGISQDDIVYNVHTKQVTIFKGDRIAQFTIGSDILTVNGAAVQMDTKVELKDGRTYLPVRYAAQAFNAPIAWDADTKTVTVN